MAMTILSSPIFVEAVLPFLLVFAVIFAVLQKTEIFGKGKKQIDAIVALVVALITVAFGSAVGIIINLMPVLAVTAVVLLVFMILYGMLFKEGSFDLGKYLRGGLGIVVGIVVIISVLVLTGAWDYIIEFYEQSDSNSFLGNVVFIVIMAVAVLIVFLSGKGGSGSKD